MDLLPSVICIFLSTIFINLIFLLRILTCSALSYHLKYELNLIDIYDHWSNKYKKQPSRIEYISHKKGAEHEACWFYQQNKQSGQLLQWKICGGQGSGKYSIVYIKTFLEQVVGPNAHGSVDWAWKWAGLFGEAGVKVFWEGKSFLLKEVSHCPFFNFFIYLTWLRLHF